MKFIYLFLLFIIFLPNEIYANNTWTAQRITTRENQNESNSWTDFVKTFETDKIPNKALARIACDSKYWLWINGDLVVFEGQLKRGPTPKDTYYDEVDIAPFLKKGSNKLAILVWYFGKDGFSHKSSGQSGLVFQCDEIGINSDESWLSRLDRGFENTGRPYPNYRLPESNVRFDARKGNFEWIKPKTKLVGFGRAKLLGEAESAPWNKLVKRPIPILKNYGIKEYINSPELPFVSTGDTIICKLPYNAHVTPYFKVESEAGKEIDIRADHYYGGGPPNVRAEYVTKNGVQKYESLGWMNGHYIRYCFPKGTRVLELKYRETGYDTEFTGDFNCNDPFFNELWKKAVRTLYVTMRDTYMDCPDRERAQWWGDMVNESGEAFYALSPSSSYITKKGMLELINWQREDGTIFSPVPAGNYDRELPGQMLASIGYYGFWNYYLNTGDKETIEQIYEGVKRYLEVWEINEKGILVHREGGWYWGDWGTNIDKQGLFNEWYYLALKGFRNMSELLAKVDAVEETESAMERFKKAFNTQFWNGKEYRSSGYDGDTDDRTQALAVVAGLADQEKYPEIYKILLSQKYASPYMEKYVIEALFQMGQAEYGLKRLKERFSEMVNDKERTTLYEGWGRGRNGFGGGSANHAWSGGGLTILSQYLCGLSPLEPAWKTIQIKPQLGNLDYASTGSLTEAGKVEVTVRRAKARYTINAKIPKGSQGIICIPTSYKKIELNERLIWNKKQKRNSLTEFLGIKDDYYQFKVNEGNWQFIANK